MGGGLRYVFVPDDAVRRAALTYPDAALALLARRWNPRARTWPRRSWASPGTRPDTAIVAGADGAVALALGREHLFTVRQACPELLAGVLAERRTVESGLAGEAAAAVGVVARGHARRLRPPRPQGGSDST